MRILRFFLTIGLIIACLFSVQAQTITGERLKADLSFLADDLLQGRGNPSQGLDVAALYLATQLQACGWEPADEENYYQTLTLKSYSPKNTKYRIAINGIPLNTEDYVFLPLGINPEKTPVRYGLAFLGQGIFAPDKNVDDFKEINLKGKAGVAFLGAPWQLDPQAIHSCDRAVGKAVQMAVRGGTLLVYVTEELQVPADRIASAEIVVLREMSKLPLAYLTDALGMSSMECTACLLITPKAFDRTLAGISRNTYAQWQKKLAGKKRLKSFDSNSSIEIAIETETVSGTAKNVIGVLKSNDPLLGNEWIVLTAHYDHMGFHEVAPGQDGIYNGADDNASGTAALLEIARRLRNDGPFRRSIMINFTCGEEMGLLGSAYFAMHSPVSYRQVVLNINADMIGRSAGNVYCITTGCDALLRKAVMIGKNNEITVMPEPHPDWRLVYFIDSFNFARFDVPFIQFMTEFHADYHQPTDEVKLIRFDELERITELIHELTKYYANEGERLIFKRLEWFLTSN